MSFVLDPGIPSDDGSQFVFTINPKEHPLYKLMILLDWELMINTILPDLKKTGAQWWYLGRKLHIRIHLAVYILQALFKMTDRETEQRIRDTPIFQVFCGIQVLKDFHIPDHTKIEKFRNRLRPETQQQLAIMVIRIANTLGFTSFQTIDVDSTVQEAGISYPSDAVLLKKLAEKVYTIWDFLKRKTLYGMEHLGMNFSEIGKQARNYFFRSKNMSIEKGREIFNTYYQIVKSQITPIINALEKLSTQDIQNLPWNIRNRVYFLLKDGKKYLEDVAHFIQYHTVKQGKRLSFHLQEVTCITKGKIGKKYEFGRVFQLGRLIGNFIIPFTCTDISMNDKSSLIPIIQEYTEFFGEGTLKEISTDKGYYSNINVETPKKFGICTDGIQRPHNVKRQPNGERVETLKRRRAGIEPLIGHVKSFGLRKSTMKSDQGVLASGYRSILAFNLHQLSKKLSA